MLTHHEPDGTLVRPLAVRGLETVSTAEVSWDSQASADVRSDAQGGRIAGKRHSFSATASAADVVLGPGVRSLQEDWVALEAVSVSECYVGQLRLAHLRSQWTAWFCLV